MESLEVFWSIGHWPWRTWGTGGLIVKSPGSRSTTGLSYEAQHTVSNFSGHCSVSSLILNGDFEPRQNGQKGETDACEENWQEIRRLVLSGVFYNLHKTPHTKQALDTSRVFRWFCSDTLSLQTLFSVFQMVMGRIRLIIMQPVALTAISQLVLRTSPHVPNTNMFPVKNKNIKGYHECCAKAHFGCFFSFF